MKHRWILAGLTTAALVAASLSAVDVAAKTPGTPPKPGIKPPKHDFSQLKLFKRDPNQMRAPQAKNPLDAPTKAEAVPPLSELERAGLRQRLGEMLKVDPATLPVFKPSQRIQAPGDTLRLDLGIPPASDITTFVIKPTLIHRFAASGPDLIHFRGVASTPDSLWPGIVFDTAAERNSIYLYICYLAKSEVTTVNIAITEHDNYYDRWVTEFTRPVIDGKVMVPFATGDHFDRLKFRLYLDGSAADKEIVLSHCDLTRVR